MKRIIVFASLILATLLSPAYSASVTVIAEGVFSSYSDPDGLLPFSEPAPGTIFRLQFTYDSDTPNISPVPEVGIFNRAISDISLRIGSDTFGIGVRNRSITILNDAVGTGGGYVDFWSASTDTATPTGTPNQALVEGYGLSLVNRMTSTPVPPLTSTDLVDPSWPSVWELGIIRYAISLQVTTQFETLALAEANITSISVVPVPAAFWLFGSAIGLLGWLNRRHA